MYGSGSRLSCTMQGLGLCARLAWLSRQERKLKGQFGGCTGGRHICMATIARYTWPGLVVGGLKYAVVSFSLLHMHC